MERRTEAEAVALVVVRLRDRFPRVPAAVVEQIVRDCHSEFRDSPIREYVPVLVESQARRLLSLRIPLQRTAGEHAS